METLIEAIRVALVPDATDEAKRQGALACRTILTALAANEGEPLAAPSEPPAPSPAPATPPPAGVAIDAQQVAAIVSALRTLPPEQLLEAAITRLRAALPADAAKPAITPLRFQIVALDQLTSRRGGS